MVADFGLWEGDLMGFTFICDCCERKHFNAKRFDVSTSEMEDDQLGVIVLNVSICSMCKDKITKELNKPRN